MERTCDASHPKATDWYERRHELRPDWVFTTLSGDIVRLDRTVPGDGTQWYVADWDNGWSHYDSTIEPGDLVAQIEDPAKASEDQRQVS